MCTVDTMNDVSPRWSALQWNLTGIEYGAGKEPHAVGQKLRINCLGDVSNKNRRLRSIIQFLNRETETPITAETLRMTTPLVRII